jgi:hypothetical protein
LNTFTACLAVPCGYFASRFSASPGWFWPVGRLVSFINQNLGQGEIFLDGSVHRDETQNPMNSKMGQKRQSWACFVKPYVKNS